MGEIEAGVGEQGVVCGLRMEGVVVSYEGSRILRGVDVEVERGGLVCLMGRNGVGKTTTLRALMGLVACEEGRIEVGGRRVDRLGPAERARSGLGYVPQGRDIFPALTVLENLRVGALSAAGEGKWNVESVLELFPVLREMLGRKGGVLSGGQQQQLAIARALLTNPSVLVLDEPTEGIQPNIIDLIGETLLKLKGAGGMSILLVEQYLDFCTWIGDRFYILERGSVVSKGAMSELTESVVRKYLTV
ncbi:MAG: urea transporter ATP-binding subunit UrtE [Verrucomicrobiota bacterium]|jgi:urea transport system ATP-binding protein